MPLTQQIVLGDTLSSASSQQLQAWMQANQTGDQRLRAGIPQAWRVADKTGSGGPNTANDVAIVWLSPRSPIVVAAYAGSSANHAQRNAVLADVGQAIADIQDAQTTKSPAPGGRRGSDYRG